MDLSFTDDQRMIRDMVREFAQKELAPKAADRDKSGEPPLEEIRKLAELGLMGMRVPAEYGGSEAGTLALALALMEIAQGDAAAAVITSVTNMVAEAIYRFGDEEQRRAFLPKVLTGDFPVGAFALTEPQAGSDARNLKTRAETDGDAFVLNGEKTFITSAPISSVFIVMAKTGAADRSAPISSFLVEKDTPGLVVGKPEKKMGLHGSPTCTVSFDNCRIPRSNRLGREGDGFKVAMMALDGGRIGVSSQSIGIARAALDFAVGYAKERQAFGAPIAKLQAIQWKIADMAMELDAAQLLVWRAACLKDAGRPFTREASMAKLYATEAANRACKEAVQILGGYGYVSDYPVERHMRDCKVTTLYEGTSEIQRLVIARHVIGE
ncbi:MAG: acyl-CoA dehydrogenase family protein [Deltaproteobacteria bacterium]|nr:acyl-CoA dehydrogenase family protein [Deltaproteobacteria bacterium]